ncbi:hypothetical protein ACQYWQ_16500 [Streptomyces sp. P6-2-1]|uniref:hypothetical protein n=1 Tax=Streptomyces sp. P6-2-1 TaxID=3422591 RepID=UPI003D36E37D
MLDAMAFAGRAINESALWSYRQKVLVSLSRSMLIPPPGRPSVSCRLHRLLTRHVVSADFSERNQTGGMRLVTCGLLAALAHPLRAGAA